ncbi:hypothetical protein AC481_04345 [miscellaneous Crenarchaeota group archaeon SMTZ-80]|nr:MAG: hypothetical protein AC481_04345 [miscellaneous Crenarchaeota group archaeon SMTZ-80]
MSKDNNDSNKLNLKNITIKQETPKDIILEENWSKLMDKHELRYELWSILKLFNELNVTEISHLVKQSKSTVSRVLIGMENDRLLISRRGRKKPEDGEKIPPKYYRINVDLFPGNK